MQLQPDLIAFKKDPEKSVIENLKDYAEILRERFDDVEAKELDLPKLFELPENIEKLNFSEDALKYFNK